MPRPVPAYLDEAGHAISFWRWIRGVECIACEIALQASLKRLDKKMEATGLIRPKEERNKS